MSHSAASLSHFGKMEEKQGLFYCYSPGVTHYLMACGIYYIAKRFNKNSNSWYCVFERNDRLDKALEGWQKFKEERRKSEDG